jgi:hypothetical protein
MKPILFAYRLTIICNAFFLYCLYVQRYPNIIHQTDLNAIIIILGWMAAPFLNLFVNIWYGVIIFNKTVVKLPVWMSIFNFLLLIIQIYVYFILPI